MTCPLNPVTNNNEIEAYTQTSSDVVYEPLSQIRDQIRLLRLEKESLQRDTLQIRLEQFDFVAQDRPEYVALSYTWQPMHPMWRVMVNGKNLEIGDNLWQFLKTLKDEECFETYFWIDQICIDQSDNDDKSEQVGRMARIYNDAKETVIWLGREDQGQDGVAALIKRIVMATTTATPKPTWRVGHAKFRDPALARLLEHSYWTRIWIIQEIMYSRKIYIKCGQQLAAWQAMTEHLARVCRIGNRGQISLDRQFNDGQISRHVAGLLRNKAVWGFGEAWKPPRRKVDLWWLLRDFEKCQCSNRRDMIYGLRGLTKDVEHLEVDYGISLISFCLKVMKTII